MSPLQSSTTFSQTTTWYAVYTQPRGEDKALENLGRQGYRVYLPRHRRWRRHARKSELVLRPLFPRYLFVEVEQQTQRWRPIRSTAGVVGLVTRGDEPLPVSSTTIEALRRREREGAFDLPSPLHGLRSGDAVRVSTGPFADIVGRLLGLRDDERVLILLDLLGRSVPVEIATDAVEAA